MVETFRLQAVRVQEKAFRGVFPTGNPVLPGLALAVFAFEEQVFANLLLEMAVHTLGNQEALVVASFLQLLGMEGDGYQIIHLQERGGCPQRPACHVPQKVAVSFLLPVFQSMQQRLHDTLLGEPAQGCGLLDWDPRFHDGSQGVAWVRLIPAEGNLPETVPAEQPFPG